MGLVASGAKTLQRLGDTALLAVLAYIALAGGKERASTCAEAGENLACQRFLDFIVPGNGFLHTSGWIDPDGV